MSRKVGVHWFRHGLRLHDNPALCDLIEECDEIYPIFIFDGEVAGTDTSGYNRWRFLLECLSDLDKTFRQYGGQLYVFKGKPTEILDNLKNEWKMSVISFEQDPEEHWQGRDNIVKKFLKKKGIKVIERVSHTLWDPQTVIEENGGNPPLLFSQFNAVVDRVGEPPRPLGQPDLSNVTLVATDKSEKRFKVPTLEEMGVEVEFPEQLKRHNIWHGGETMALELFKSRLTVEKAAFKGGFIMPNQFKPDLTCPPLSMSPLLRFGCLSIRRLYWSIHDMFKETKPELEMVPMMLTAQCRWREYFYVMSVGNELYDKMEGNDICLQIEWQNNEEYLNAYEMGKTGFPFIDAAMNQLRMEGWIHHVARHAVASFLTRGDMWISWEKGLALFYKYQLDADWSVCAGNWMWISSSAFEKCLDCPACFDPILYGKRMDPTGDYIRRYVPALKNLPLRYLFQPWLTPRAVQEKANCRIPEDYPAPILNHGQASKKNRDYMAQLRHKLTSTTKTPHCRPTNSEEMRSFAWLPQTLVSGSCKAGENCPGLEDL